ncbi:MAG TPA: GGDEF-domain containing protein, partial [Gammaproteobacteria bacterium]|nr:GGDEF-domain containing protein [Gammaproteobacteria bacterium]
GYSSLSYLKRFPIDTLKIDRSFVNEIGINSSGEAIIKAIIAMGQSLGLRLVAEGVEQLNQLQYLALQSCEVVQGYYFSKPLFAKEFLEFYHNQGAHRRSAASA